MLSSSEFFKTWKHSLAQDFKNTEGNDLPYAPNHPRSWGSEDLTTAPPKPTFHIAISKDDTLIATASGGDIFIYEISTGSLRQTLHDPVGEVNEMRFRPTEDSGILVAVYLDRKDGRYVEYFRFWKLEEEMQKERKDLDGVKEAGLVGARAAAKSLGLDLDITNLASKIEGELYLSKLEAEVKKGTSFKGYMGSFGSEPFSSDGTRLLYISERGVSERNKVVCLNCGSLPATEKFKTGRHGDSIMWIGFRPDNKVFATSCWDHIVRLFNAETGQLIHTLVGGKNQSWKAAFSPDGSMIAAGNGDKSARIWNAESGELLHTFPGFNNWIRNLAFAPDGKSFAAGADGMMRVFSLPSGEEIHTWKIRMEGAHFMELSSESTMYSRDSVLFFMTPDGRVFGFDEKRAQKLYFGPEGDVAGSYSRGPLAVSHDGAMLFTLDQEGRVCGWSLRR